MKLSGSVIICALIALAACGCACSLAYGPSPGDYDNPEEETVPVVPVYPDEGIFVSMDGDDATGDGTQGNPYATIQHVLDSVAEEGDTIIVRAGTYSEAIRIRLPRISIRAMNGEAVSITAPIDNENIVSTVIFDVDSDGSALQNLDISGGYYYCIMHFTKWDWGEPDRSGACGTLIEGCTIHDSGRDCIKITPGCDDVIIRNCEIYNSGARDGSNAEGIDCVNADRVIVQDCHIHDIATNGLYFKGGSIACVAERLLVEDCGSCGILLGFDTSPEFFDLDVNPEYYENINGIVRNCIVARTRYAGIGMYAALNPQVYNNTIVDSANDAHSAIYFGLTYQDWDPAAGRPSSTGAVIKNNIVYQSDPDVVFIRYEDDLGGMSALSGMPEMSNNCYWVTSGTPVFTDDRPSFAFGGNLAGWQTHISGDAQSFVGNPLLGSTFRLLAGSPCIDAGATLSLVSYDIDGDARAGVYDIGADER